MTTDCLLARSRSVTRRPNEKTLQKSYMQAIDYLIWFA
jgi:hypothetical protein